MVFQGCEQYPLTWNLNIDPRYIGLESRQSPFVMCNSSQRMDMFSNHLPQVVIPKYGEVPLISTGDESRLIKYTNDPARRDQPIKVLATIQKYQPNIGTYPIKQNPRVTVIYQGLDDDEINYFDITTYTKCADGFGYMNTIHNRHRIAPDTPPISPEMKIMTSPAVDGSQYKLGINANIAYMTLQNVDEDAFVASQEGFADKLESTAVNTVNFDIKPNCIPLNSYGTGDSYQIFPNIGETVNEKGILCALRDISDSSLITDTRPAALSVLQVHDNVVYAKPGAEIIDIDVFINESRYIKTPAEILYQPRTYWRNRLNYYESVYEFYRKMADEGMAMSQPFIALVDRCMQMMLGYGERLKGIVKSGKPATFTIKRDPISFIHVSITYKFQRKLTKGSKVTGREGGKGVLAEIWPKADMPKDKFGNVADLIINVASVPNRMNTSQIWECGINYVGSFVRRQAADLLTQTSLEAAYAHIVQYVNRINPNFYEYVIKPIVEDSVAKKTEYVNTCIKDGILLVCPPSLNTITPQLIIDLYKMFNVQESPVTFNLKDEEGNFLREITTVDNVVIGSKYMYLLCKIPSASSTSMAYLNQYKLPVKPHAESRIMSPITVMPLRSGEDEIRQLGGGLSDELLARFTSMYANSYTAAKCAYETILTAQVPSNINRVPMTTEDMLDTNEAIGLSQHMFSTVGIDTKHIKLVPPSNKDDEAPWDN